MALRLRRGRQAAHAQEARARGGGRAAQVRARVADRRVCLCRCIMITGAFVPDEGFVLIEPRLRNDVRFHVCDESEFISAFISAATHATLARADSVGGSQGKPPGAEPAADPHSSEDAVGAQVFGRRESLTSVFLTG